MEFTKLKEILIRKTKPRVSFFRYFLYCSIVTVEITLVDMSQRDYRSMSHMPSHGNASNTNAGNARESYQTDEADVRENFQMKGGHPGNPMMRKAGRMAGEYAPGLAGQFTQQQCHFPQAPPARCYCQPAPFTSLDGRQYFTITNAYGNSRPCPSFY